MSEEMPKQNEEDKTPKKQEPSVPPRTKGSLRLEFKHFTGFDIGGKKERKETPLNELSEEESLAAKEFLRFTGIKRRKQQKEFNIETGKLEEIPDNEPLPPADAKTVKIKQKKSSFEEYLKTYENPITMATPEIILKEGAEPLPSKKEKYSFRDKHRDDHEIVVNFTQEGIISDYEESGKKKSEEAAPKDMATKKSRAKILKPHLHKLTKKEQILDSQIPEHNINFQKGRIKTLENMERDIKDGNVWKKNERKSYEIAWDNLRNWAQAKKPWGKIWGENEDKEYKKEIENMRTLIRIGEHIQQRKKDENKPQEDHLAFKQEQAKLLKNIKEQMGFDGKWDAEARSYNKSSWEKLQSFSINRHIWTDEDEKEFKRETAEIRDPEKWKVGLGIITFALYGFIKAETMIFQKMMEMVGKLDKDLDIYSDYKKSVKMRKDFFSGKLFKDILGKQQMKKGEGIKPPEVNEREVNKKRKESEIAFWKKEGEKLRKEGLLADEKHKRDYEKVWRAMRVDWIANQAWNKDDEEDFRNEVGYAPQQESDTYITLSKKRWLQDMLTSAERGDLRSLQDRKRKREKDALNKKGDEKNDIDHEIEEIKYDMQDIKDNALNRWQHGEWPPYTQNEGKTKGKKGKGGGKKQEEAPEREEEGEKGDNAS